MELNVETKNSKKHVVEISEIEESLYKIIEQKLQCIQIEYLINHPIDLGLGYGIRIKYNIYNEKIQFYRRDNYIKNIRFILAEDISSVEDIINSIDKYVIEYYDYLKYCKEMHQKLEKLI